MLSASFMARSFATASAEDSSQTMFTSGLFA